MVEETDNNEYYIAFATSKFDVFASKVSLTASGDIITTPRRNPKHQLQKLGSHQSEITSIKFALNSSNRKNHVIYTSSLDGCIKMWDVSKECCVATFVTSLPDISDDIITHNHCNTKSASKDNDEIDSVNTLTKVTQTPTLSASLSSHIFKSSKLLKKFKSLLSLDINCDSSVMAAGTEMILNQDSFIIFWDLSPDSDSSRDNTESINPTGAYFEVHSNDVTDVKFHPDIRHILATSCSDGTVNVFDIRVSESDGALLYALNTEICISKLHWFPTSQKDSKSKKEESVLEQEDNTEPNVDSGLAHSAINALMITHDSHEVEVWRPDSDVQSFRKFSRSDICSRTEEDVQEDSENDTYIVDSFVSDKIFSKSSSSSPYKIHMVVANTVWWKVLGFKKKAWHVLKKQEIPKFSHGTQVFVCCSAMDTFLIGGTGTNAIHAWNMRSDVDSSCIVPCKREIQSIVDDEIKTKKVKN